MDCSTFSYDLHVLGTPPALILSQDQTLVCNLSSCLRVVGRTTIAVSARKGTVMASPLSENGDLSCEIARTYARVTSLTTGTFNLVVKDRIAIRLSGALQSEQTHTSANLPVLETLQSYRGWCDTVNSQESQDFHKIYTLWRESIDSTGRNFSVRLRTTDHYFRLGRSISRHEPRRKSVT